MSFAKRVPKEARGRAARDRPRPPVGGVLDGPGHPVPPFEVVIVAYHSRHHVARLLDGLAPTQPVAIVDNSEDADGISELARGPHRRYVRGEGKGFARAANLGASTSTHDYVVFCNPDTRPDAGVLRELVSVLVEDPLCAASAPLTVDRDGRTRLGTAGWEPTLRRTLIHALGLHRAWPSSGLVARPHRLQHVDAEWLTGACLAVRRTVFLSLGGFDESFFVYCEDVALGRATRDRGMHQVLRTDLVVEHAREGSGAPSLEMNRLKGASVARYLAMNNPRGRARAMRALLVLGYALRILERTVRADVRTAREHLAYVRGITTGRATVAGVPVSAP